MRLKEHPNIEWPPIWSEGGERALRGEDGILKDVDLIEPSKLLLSSEIEGQVFYAELHCFNDAFASRLHEKIMPFVGKPVREVGELDF